MRITTRRFIFLILLIPATTIAQAADMHAGVKSMAIKYYLGVEEFSTGLNGKYYFSPDLALLGELQFSVLNSENNTSTSSIKTDSNAISFSGGLRKYFHKGDINIFGDGQMLLGYRKSKQSSESGSNQVTSETSGYDLGLIAEVGTEYFLSSSISISAKTGVQYVYFRSKQKTSSSNASPKSKQTSLSTSETSIAFNVYW